MTVRVRNLTKAFSVGGSPAVSDVSFEAPRGNITALLGPSGAGKSTALRLVAGLEIPDSGTIWIDGDDVSSVPVQRRGIGLVFQNYALFEHMTVRKNIGFGLEVRNMRKAEIKSRVDELLALIQLEAYGHRFPSELSGGQRQRVAFARALAPRPRVLLLDEPFGALDARVRQELRDWLHAMHEETHVTTLMVTHDQNEALELAEHVVVMFNGRVAQAAAPSALYDHPANPQVAAFIGGTNVLRGRVREGRVEAGLPAMQAPEDAEDGARVHAFVRPHDVRIARPGEDNGNLALARVERLRRVGGYVKLSLMLSSGEKMNVEIAKQTLDELGVGEGDSVRINADALKVFVGDYVI